MSEAAVSSMMSFKPVNTIHQHICGFHTYAQDRTRHVEAHHFCSHLSPDFHQCVIYDSNDPKARLIGIEYIVSEKIFANLPSEEKRYWHSHKYEVESGVLQLQVKGPVPAVATDVAERPVILELQKTYGKTIHTWAIDATPELPLGPPNLMMAYTDDSQVSTKMVQERDKRWGMSTQGKKEARKRYLPPYETLDGADGWETSGKAIVFDPVEQDHKA